MAGISNDQQTPARSKRRLAVPCSARAVNCSVTTCPNPLREGGTTSGPPVSFQLRYSRSPLPFCACDQRTSTLPAGTDSVIRQEDTDYGAETVTITNDRDVGVNWRKAGEDIQKGAIALEQGAFFERRSCRSDDPMHLGGAAHVNGAATKPSDEEPAAQRKEKPTYKFSRSLPESQSA